MYRMNIFYFLGKFSFKEKITHKIRYEKNLEKIWKMFDVLNLATDFFVKLMFSPSYEVLGNFVPKS